MRESLFGASLSLVFVVSATAQSNAIPGLDASIYDVGSATIYGRTGPAYPNGVAGIVHGHSMANCGSVHIPWDGVVGGQLVDQHLKIAFLLARESNGRMVQVSGKSHCKHSRIAFNFSGNSPCGPCQSGPANTFRIGCYDIYGAGFNGNRSYLGPTPEIDPWLGTWDPVGSYFDIGDPQQGNYPQPADGVQSLDTTGFDVAKNRMEVPESELVQPGVFYAQNQVVVGGEPVANRGNNLVSAAMAFNWNGSSWSATPPVGAQAGSVLTRWTGAANGMASNGADDGRFMVACRVTGPVEGLWHYEYAVHNIDNQRGGASLRIPVCPTARVENIGFRDIDGDPLNDWSTSVSGGEVQILASANNPLDWNTIYNVWFDSDVAPVAGSVTIDEARLGPGALSVAVPIQVPGLQGTAHLGAGCGTPETGLWANGVPASPNPGYALEASGGAGNFVLVAFAAAPATAPIGASCTLFVDANQILVSDLVQLDAGGSYSYAVPVPAGLAPTDLAVQAFEFYPNGPFLGFGGSSNGLLIRAAGTGCR
ncbi:MAG: hypothetical protein AB8H80_22680 [Planctomycetota bacterium]